MPNNYDPTWECYPKTSRPIGESSEREVTITKGYACVLTVDDQEQLTLYSRSRDFHNKYSREFCFNDPVIYEDLGASVNEGGSGSSFETSGEITEAFSYLDTQLIFMDLRHDIFVYRQIEGSLSFGGSGGNPIGDCLIDDGAGLQRHVTNDVAGVNANHTVNRKVTEELVIKTPSKNLELYVNETNTPVEMNVGSTDYSGWCGALAYGCLVWGTYGVVDETEPHPSKDGYTPLYETSFGSYPADYLPPWIDGVPAFTENDKADAERFNSLFGTNTTDAEEVSVEVPTDPFPQGSWAVDKNGNLFISQLHSGGTYNILIKTDGTETDPVTVIDIPAGGDTVYYPVAPT